MFNKQKCFEKMFTFEKNLFEFEFYGDQNRLDFKTRQK